MSVPNHIVQHPGQQYIPFLAEHNGTSNKYGARSIEGDAAGKGCTLRLGFYFATSFVMDYTPESRFARRLYPAAAASSSSIPARRLLD